MSGPSSTTICDIDVADGEDLIAVEYVLAGGNATPGTAPRPISGPRRDPDSASPSALQYDATCLI